VMVEARSVPSRSLIKAGVARSSWENGDEGARPRVVWARTRVFGGTTEKRRFQIPEFLLARHFFAWFIH